MTFDDARLVMPQSCWVLRTLRRQQQRTSGLQLRANTSGAVISLCCHCLTEQVYTPAQGSVKLSTTCCRTITFTDNEGKRPQQAGVPKLIGLTSWYAGKPIRLHTTAHTAILGMLFQVLTCFIQAMPQRCWMCACL